MKTLYNSLVIFAIVVGAYIFGSFGGAIACTAGAKTSDKIPLTVVMYHNITQKSSLKGKYAVTTDEFEKDLKYLSANGYTSVAMSDVINYAYNGTPLPEKPVIITFDDGYESFYAYAYPLLKQYNFKAVVSVVGEFSQRYTDLDVKKAEDCHNLDYSYLNWSQVKELSDSGIVELGNHTNSMHYIKNNRKGCAKKQGESTESYEKALTEDIGTAQTLIEQATGKKCEIFTYPYGSFSAETPEILRKTGFNAVMNCTERINYISRDNIDWLYNICRFNRPSGISSESFFSKME